jgi:hypothetical protein
LKFLEIPQIKVRFETRPIAATLASEMVAGGYFIKTSMTGSANAAEHNVATIQEQSLTQLQASPDLSPLAQAPARAQKPAAILPPELTQESFQAVVQDSGKGAEEIGI